MEIIYNICNAGSVFRAWSKGVGIKWKYDGGGFLAF